MKDIIRNIFFDNDITYRTYGGADKVFTQDVSDDILILGNGSEVEVDMDKQIITKVINVVNTESLYCNHCGKKFSSGTECYAHSRNCEERGYLRHPEGEDLDGVYKRRRRLNSNNG